MFRRRARGGKNENITDKIICSFPAGGKTQYIVGLHCLVFNVFVFSCAISKAITSVRTSQSGTVRTGTFILCTNSCESIAGIQSIADFFSTFRLCVATSAMFAWSRQTTVGRNFDCENMSMRALSPNISDRFTVLVIHAFRKQTVLSPPPKKTSITARNSQKIRRSAYQAVVYYQYI